MAKCLLGYTQVMSCGVHGLVQLLMKMRKSAVELLRVGEEHMLWQCHGHGGKEAKCCNIVV